MDKKRFLTEFLKKQTLAVVSTVTRDGNAEAALVGFGQTDDLAIIFGTNIKTRKYQNIMHNPRVAMVIGWNNRKTVQLEGRAEELTDIQLVRDNYWSKTPSAEKYKNEAGQCYFIVRPDWLRYTDISTEPNEIIELRI